MSIIQENQTVRFSLSDESYLRANYPGVVSETIEGETIVIHLKTGTYYSLERTAVDIWQVIEVGITLGELLTGMRQWYDQNTEEEEMETSTRHFIKNLIQEELIVVDPNFQKDSENQSSRLQAAIETSVFTIPTFEKYTDMQDLLLLDPIHEVDISGWPERPESSESETESA